jgi:hypothetical protein
MRKLKLGWDSKEKKWRLIKEMHTFKKWLRNGARLHFSFPVKEEIAALRSQ